MKDVNEMMIYIQRAKAGDIQAFTAIVSNYQRMIFTIILKIVGNREDAEDITQEVFIKIFKSLRTFKGESSFSTWIYRIAYNTTLSELRRKKPAFYSIDENSSDVNDTDTMDSDYETKEIKLQYLNESLKKLSPDELFLVTLYYSKEQSIEEISKISNLSVSNVRVKLHRIRKKLAVEINLLIQNEDK
jgi:RNA polymerase sigma-70 factor (ECF subfamily)